MEFSTEFKGREEEIADMFAATFTDSEGAEEGTLIGGLVREILIGTPDADLHVFIARSDGAIVGAAIFSRLRYAGDARSVFILSPMAVATGRQGAGIGRDLLRHALGALRDAGVEIAVTYGDPAFYGQVGFRPMTEEIAPAPLPLTHPEGWIGQSLTGAELTPLRGPCACVTALDKPALW